MQLIEPPPRSSQSAAGRPFGDPEREDLDDSDHQKETRIVSRSDLGHQPDESGSGLLGVDQPTLPGAMYRFDRSASSSDTPTTPDADDDHRKTSASARRRQRDVQAAGGHLPPAEARADEPRNESSGYETMPMPDGLDAGFSDAVTGVLSAGDLYRRLREMRAADAEADRDAQESPSAASVLADDRQDVATSVLAEIVETLRGLSAPAKLGVGALVLSLCAGLGVGVFGLWRNTTRVAYLTEAHVLLAGPGPQEAVGQLGVLGRGEEITLYARIGGYAMVADALGRAGYVRRAVLSRTRPEVVPELPFAGCRPTLVELSAEPCLERAESQATACQRFCEREAVTPDCFDDCRARLADCRISCEGRAPPPEAGPTVHPSVRGRPQLATPPRRHAATPGPQGAAGSTGREPGADGALDEDSVATAAGPHPNPHAVNGDPIRRKGRKQRKKRKPSRPNNPNYELE